MGMPSELPMRHRTPHFMHIFSSDSYSAGYYSYLWADALTADAAERFVEAGSFYDKDVAKSLHDNVMSIGDTIDPAEGFRRFRGRDVDTSALLRSVDSQSTESAVRQRSDEARTRTDDDIPQAPETGTRARPVCNGIVSQRYRRIAQ